MYAQLLTGACASVTSSDSSLLLVLHSSIENHTQPPEPIPSPGLNDLTVGLVANRWNDTGFGGFQ